MSQISAAIATVTVIRVRQNVTNTLTDTVSHTDPSLCHPTNGGLCVVALSALAIFDERHAIAWSAIVIVIK